MRIAIPLLIIVLGPAFGAEPPAPAVLAPALRVEPTAETDNAKNALSAAVPVLREAAGTLAGRCARVGIAAPAGLSDALARQATAVEAWLKQVESGAPIDGALQDFNQRMMRTLEGVNYLSNLIQQLDTEGQRFPHCQGSAEFTALHDLGREEGGAALAALMDGRDPSHQAQAGQEREHVLEALLTLAEAERAAAETYAQLPADQAPLRDYLAFCHGAHDRLAALAPGPKADERAGSTEPALQLWQESLQCEIAQRELEHAHPNAQDPLRLAAKATATALQEALRAAAAAQVAPDRDAAEFERATQAREARLGVLRDAVQAVAALAQFSTDVDGQRKRIGEALPKCGEARRAALTTRRDQEDAAFAAALTAALAAQSGDDRVAAIERRSEVALIALRLDHLADEAEQEAELAETERRWAGHAQDAALAEQLKHYEQAREALAKARAARLAHAVLEQQVRDRIELLQFKDQVLQQQGEALDHALEHAHEEAQHIGEQLGETVEQGDPKQRERDAKGAERIPVKSPADNF